MVERFTRSIITTLRGERKIIDPERPFNPTYWEAMPLRVPEVAETLQLKRRCDQWAMAALQVVRKDGYGTIFKDRCKMDQSGHWLWEVMGIWQHWYLAAEHNNRTFIADGTAGQFFGEQPPYTGYFGYLDEAPPLLRRVYLYDGHYLPPANFTT